VVAKKERPEATDLEGEEQAAAADAPPAHGDAEVPADVVAHLLLFHVHRPNHAERPVGPQQGPQEHPVLQATQCDGQLVKGRGK
jgi:hypothetical protein